jgi:Uma2 family endonuclease
MSAIVESPHITLEEFLALPDDPSVDREVIRGELREKPMTMRNRRHSPAESRVSQQLWNWLDSRPSQGGLIVAGEAGFILKRDPLTGVGIDVAYVSQEIAANDPTATYFQGPPVLAVEILSPSDKQEEIDEKIALFLEAGVKVVWVVNPTFKTVTVYRPDAAPALYHESQTIDAEPHLPGFRAQVKAFF